MAYSQQPQYGAMQKPSYHYQETNYDSPHQPYAAEYGYDTGHREVDLHGMSRQSPQQYQDNYRSNGGGLAQKRSQIRDLDVDERYGSRQQVRKDRFEARGDTHQPRDRDMRSQGAPRSKSRPPETTRKQPAADNYYTIDHPQVRQQDQGHYAEQVYHPNPTAYSQQGNQNDNWQDQHNGWNNSRGEMRTPQSNSEPPKGLVPRQRGSPIPYGSSPSQSDYSRFKSEEPAKPARTAPSDTTSRSETSQRSKVSNKAMAKTIANDTVAWDNPFPTFPMRPKKGTHASAKSLDNSAPNLSLGDRRHERDIDDRPQTASSKSISYTIPQPHYAEDAVYSSEVNKHVHQNPLKHHGDDSASEQRNHLKPPGMAGRHSEDNRVRPTPPVDVASEPSYQRSRTMPIAISESVAKPNSRPRPPLQTSWQEPGPTAGYYGPDDRGFTPSTPIDAAQHDSYEQPGSKRRGNRPYGHGAIQNVEANSQHQLHTPQDSIGDVFDNYYDSPQYNQYPPSTRYPEDEDMPRFDSVPEPWTSYKQDDYIDKHLELQQRPQDNLSMRDPHNEHERNIRRPGPYTNESLPRSRSQPDLKDRRPPRQQEDDNFNFGLPEPYGRPPATAPEAASGEYPRGPGNFSRFPVPTGPPSGGFPDRRMPGPQGSGAAATRSGAEPHLGFDGPRGIGQSSAAFQGNGPPHRFRSPPQDGPHNFSNAATYQNYNPSSRYRSPPLQAQQRSMRPPGPPPQSAPIARNPPTDAYPNRKHSPPPQGGQHLGARMRSPNGAPPPTNSQEHTSPLTKPLPNPDALPAHPAPVRKGLAEGSPVNQVPKPAPVRQYNAVPSPMQLSEPPQKAGGKAPHTSGSEAVPVTHQELDRLKQKMARNPDDLATQLLLAKKMVEAATTLVDERADTRARSKGREKYIMEAYKLVKKLSSSGYSEATFYLADSYTRGALGLESDTREAFKHYQTAAKSGHAQAAYRVAVCCEIGQEEGGGTSRDPVKAMQWYKRAATLGDTPAMYKMGIISLKGLLGQPKNAREALTWLKRAAERADKENPHALHELGLMHEKPNSHDGITKDEAYASRLFTQAANLGYKFSQYRLGCAYEYGSMGFSVDPRQSIAWYSKAAVQEEHQSELALSGWYLTGSEGILQQSDTEAYLWARKAAQAGLAKAEYAMGYFTEVGIGAPANLEDAKRWYWRAASQNFPKARDRLEELRKGGPTKRKERVSRSNMRKSTEGECVVM